MAGKRQGVAATRGAPPQATDLPEGVRAAVVEARLSAIDAIYPGRFNEEQRMRVRTNLAHALDLAARLRRVPLANSDEPDSVFVPYRGAGSREAEADRS